MNGWTAQQASHYGLVSDITVQHNTIYTLWFINFTSYLYSYSVVVLIPDLLFSCLWKLRLLLFSVPFTLSEGFLITGLVLGRTLLKFPSRIHSCWSPSSGVMRLVGSQLNIHSRIIKSEPQDCYLIFYQHCNSHQRQFHFQCTIFFIHITYVRQRLMKSRNNGSVVFKAVDSSLELGIRFFPLLLVMFLGFPLESNIKHIWVVT